MADYAIGAFDFYLLTRKPRQPTSHSVTEVRPGKCGRAILLPRSFVDPFETVSMVDFVSPTNPNTVDRACEQRQNIRHGPSEPFSKRPEKRESNESSE